jgi:hypothetical protein
VDGPRDGEAQCSERAKMMNPSEVKGNNFPRLAKVRGSTLRIKVNS